MKRANLFAQVLPAFRVGGAAMEFNANSATRAEERPLPGGITLLDCTARILGAALDDRTSRSSSTVRPARRAASSSPKRNCRHFPGE